eukprot:326584_1
MSKRKRGSKKAKNVTHYIFDELLDTMLFDEANNNSANINKNIDLKHKKKTHCNSESNIIIKQYTNERKHNGELNGFDANIIGLIERKLKKCAKVNGKKKNDNRLIKYNKQNHKTIQMNQYIKLNVLWNDLSEDEHLFICQLIVLYLPINSSIAFYSFCKRYCSLFKCDYDLWFWRNLYQRDYGKIKFKKRKGKRKGNKNEQLIQFNQKRNNSNFWKTKYKFEQNKQWKIRYNKTKKKQLLTMVKCYNKG